VSGIVVPFDQLKLVDLIDELIFLPGESLDHEFKALSFETYACLEARQDFVAHVHHFKVQERLHFGQFLCVQVVGFQRYFHIL
jgi:hypothetical protein